MYSDAELDFAYRYPFSEEAKKVIKELDFKHVDPKHVATGRARLEEAFQNGRVDFKETGYGKAEVIIGYIYARMLVSALKNLGLVMKYSSAEAKRTASALELDSNANMIRVANQLGINTKQKNGDFVVEMTQFLNNLPSDDGVVLANQRLVGGEVILDKHQLIKVIESAAKKAIEKGLPIKTTELPKSVVDAAREVKLPVLKIETRVRGGSVSWIDKLLGIAIADCRHRTVNLILAPYLVNVKGMEPDKAAEMISNYIAMCRKLNPDTRITDRYIKYQCDYAKQKGIRPMSLRRAMSELGGGIDFEILLGDEEKEEAVVKK